MPKNEPDQTATAPQGHVASTDVLGVVVDREWTAADQEWADKQAEEHAAWWRDQQEDARAVAAWVRKMRRKHRRCTDCVEGIDGEDDGMGGCYASTCQTCNGTGWVLKTPNVGAERQ